MTRLLLIAAAAAMTISVRADDSKPISKLDSKPKTSTIDDVSILLNTLHRSETGPRKPVHEAFDAVLLQLQNEDTAAAMRLLDRRSEFKIDRVLEKRLASMMAEKQAVVAAKIMLQCLRSDLTVNALFKGGVVIGRVVIEDGKLDPEWVLAQMPILDGGYFAGEVGSMKKPLRFRAAGYEDVAVPLAGEAVACFDVGTVTMKPLKLQDAAGIKGKVSLDLPDRGRAKVEISLNVPKANTPHGGVSPRRRWPESTKVVLENDGSFHVNGLTPGEYFLQITAKLHAGFGRTVQLEPGKEKDFGSIRLSTTDLGFYLQKPAPEIGELPWEKNYQTAMKNAANSKKPVMLMMTAAWCGPCKSLENETLNDPWVKHFLSNFLIVKADEDKEVQAKHPINTYPTLIFLDSAGKEVHRMVGYKQPVPFLIDCVKALKKLSIKIPDDLQILIDKRIVSER